jgi:hypothetical protein
MVSTFRQTASLRVSTALFIAVDNAMDPDRPFLRDCTNRQTVAPWTDHGCVDGEAFTFDNPLYSDLYRATVDWSLSLRLPAGHRPPLADAVAHNVILIDGQWAPDPRSPPRRRVRPGGCRD